MKGYESSELATTLLHKGLYPLCNAAQQDQGLGCSGIERGVGGY